MDPLLNKMIDESGNWLSRLQAAQKNPDFENIHLFRLAIKQLNAFSAVSGFPDNKNIHLKTYLFLQKCFKTAGAIRNASLQNEKLSGLQGDLLSMLLQKNAEKADKAKIKFIQMLQQFPAADLLKFQTAFAYELERLGPHQLLLLLNKTILSNIKKLNKLISKDHYKKAMHPMRIIIRRLIELLQVIEPFEKNNGLDNFQILLKDLNKKMGNWHDAEAFLESLKSSSKKNQIATTEILELSANLQAEMASLEKEIAELFEKGLESA